MDRMHIAVISSTQGGKTYYSKLLRRSYRKDGKVQKKTLANLSHLDDGAIELLRGHLKGRTFVDAGNAFEILETRSHGAVRAVTEAFDRLDIARLIGARPSRERDLVCAMIAARILRPHTKLATTRWWQTSTLAQTFGVGDAGVDELYGAMDWLLKRQNRIQGKLARRLFTEGGLVLFDLTSSYVEGRHCPLARRGYSRDGKKGKLQVNFGLLCDVRGRPAAVSVHRGDIGDTATLAGEVERLQKRFGLARVVLVGDRGMIVQARIDALRKLDGVDWITALKSAAIRKLMRRGALDRLDEVDLFELFHPDFPGERLVACRNTRLAALRARTRQSLLEATEGALDGVRRSVESGRLKGAAQIGLRVGREIDRYKVRKHFDIEIAETSFRFARREEAIAAEAALDGIYVIRTSLPAQDMTAPDCVRSYKTLTRVERAFRTIKTVNLHVRPIHHRTPDRVRAHIFLCMLAWYVEWHMREAWRPLLFADCDLEEDARTRDPVAPAQRSRGALHKVRTGRIDDGTPAHCFRTLIETLETITRNRCRVRAAHDREQRDTFEVTTQPNVKQQEALDLLGRIAELSQAKARL